MTEAVMIIIPGDPVPFARAGRNGKRSFTPTPQKNHMDAIGYAANQAMRGRARLSGPLMMIVEAVYQPPKSWNSIERAAAATCGRFRTSKPDADNLAKLCADAIKGIVYSDDALIAVGPFPIKRYGETSQTTILVEELPSFGGASFPEQMRMIAQRMEVCR